MITYGNERALTITHPDSYTTELRARQQIEYDKNLATTINSHAVMIDELHKRMGDMVAFMEWVSNTHPYVWGQYKAIKDLEEASK